MANSNPAQQNKVEAPMTEDQKQTVQEAEKQSKAKKTTTANTQKKTQPIEPKSETQVSKTKRIIRN